MQYYSKSQCVKYIYYIYTYGSLCVCCVLCLLGSKEIIQKQKTPYDALCVLHIHNTRSSRQSFSCGARSIDVCVAAGIMMVYRLRGQ